MSFSVDPRGAYLLHLTASDGTNIVLPREEVTSGKYRGGCHICLPNFGPGGDTGLHQHGFARDAAWHVEDQTDTMTALTLDGATCGSPKYQHMVARLDYEEHDDALTASLIVRNNGTEAFAIAPGFHPYFALSGDATLDGEAIDPREYTEARFVDGDTHTLQTGSKTITIQSEGLSTYAIWSGNDASTPYVCVEPTHSGNSFSEPGDAMLYLPGGESVHFSMRISW